MKPRDSTRPGVVMVTGAYFPEVSGGGLQCQTMIRALGQSIAFRVLTTCTDPALPRETEIDGVVVTRLFVDLARPVTKLVAAVRALAFLIRYRASFHIVHLHGFSQKSTLIALAAQLLRKKVIVTIHTAEHDEPDGVRRLGAFAYWIYSRADLFITISAPLTTRYLAAGLPADRLWPASNGVDVSRFRPVDPHERVTLRRALGLDPDVCWILFVGFFSREKAPDVLFDAWLRLATPDLPATGLVFVGAAESAYPEVDAALVQRIREEATARGLSHRVVVSGVVHDVERYYQAVDLFVAPSVREAFGMALVEAMASGRPVVATRIAGVTDAIVEDGITGELVPPRDVDALADTLRRLLRDPARAAAMGARARAAIVDRFAVSGVAERWRRAYAKVLS